MGWGGDHRTFDTGTSESTYAWYTEYHYTYDANGQLTVLDSDLALSYTYDAAGRTTGMSDPYLGHGDL